MTKFIRGLYNLTPVEKKAVITIGNFDGVHKGHQALIDRLKYQAEKLQSPSFLITFEPQPLEYFKQKKVPRLMRWREKYCALKETGVENILLLRFNHALAHLTATDFVKNILVDALKVEHLLVGDDFRFGYKREGDFSLLAKKGLEYGFTVEAMNSVCMEGERVSSTRIRNALLEGKLDQAQQLLGHPYSMMGKVVHGDKLGRKLGFPTANIFLHRSETPVQGIFTVKMHGISEVPLNGVANVGIRPTVGGTTILLEVYLLDFDQDIYGKQVVVEFCKKLRDEEYYPSLDELKLAIAKDVEEARFFFKTQSH